MMDSAFGSSHGSFLQRPAEQVDAVPVVRTRTCKFSCDFGPRDAVEEINYDVDQLHDVLPQPYRFINQLLGELVETSTGMVFQDQYDTGLTTGQLQWRINAADSDWTDQAMIMYPGKSVALGQLLAWSNLQGTPFRIAVDLSGAVLACASARPFNPNFRLY